MANAKISITAEFASIIKAKTDPRNMYFVSDKGRKLYNAVKKVISEKKLKEIFDWRLELSKRFDEKISESKPEQVIEIAAGYSLRGLNLCLKDKNIIYIDTDLENVIFRKKEILDKICEKENISFPKNYHLVEVDALSGGIFEKLGNFASPDKKTLIFAEGLTSYFSNLGFETFLINIKELLSHFNSGEFYSHENIYQPKGVIYQILRSFFVSALTKSKRRAMFKNPEEFENYLKKINVNNYKPDLGNSRYLFYSIYS